MHEKRRLKRRHLIFYLRIFDTANNQLIGYLVDLTPEGIMVMSENPIETGKMFRLKMDLPSEYSEIEHIEFDAQSVWCSADINPDFYDTGFKFSSITLDEKKVIEDIIGDLGFEDTE